ncbi:hypothetical protein ASPCADRAFT_504983 [Aspergillus carbonarius ITEM 5010]|uniref:Uncharacterized protein n=1 Tax=Aspergillus carbonarius (strain ITEM 5010) TaxID=602072 RepID=A0A1R3RTW6_ASPC5|nr:hypothetical protein ASPCADRAFT_504983 [Aspergillus carbonarius ITEM 5010]
MSDRLLLLLSPRSTHALAGSNHPVEDFDRTMTRPWSSHVSASFSPLSCRPDLDIYVHCSSH